MFIAAELAPVFHTYVPPPVAVSTVLCPEHREVLPVMETVGEEETLTVPTAVALQPPALVTVTV